MPEPYQEMIEGAMTLRLPARDSHECICRRLHDRVSASLIGSGLSRLLPMRAEVQLNASNRFCPDLALVTASTSRLWLAAEVINMEDHHADTVQKKSVYEEIRLTRLWMIDPRYESVEIYHASQYGLVLKQALAGKERIEEPLLPGFSIAIAELFASPSALEEPGRFGL